MQMKLDSVFKIEMLPKKAALVKTGEGLEPYPTLCQLLRPRHTMLGLFGKWIIRHSPKCRALWVKAWR